MLDALLPVIVLPDIAGVAYETHAIAPPNGAVFPVNRFPVTLGFDFEQYKPPPLEDALFWVIVLFAIIGEDGPAQYTPPPLAALPLRMVKPSIRAAALRPAGMVTTLPPAEPSRIVS